MGFWGGQIDQQTIVKPFFFSGLEVQESTPARSSSKAAGEMGKDAGLSQQRKCCKPLLPWIHSHYNFAIPKQQQS
eukprot:2237062-Amphidinium_carterae.1